MAANSNSVDSKFNTILQATEQNEKEISRLSKEVTSLRRQLEDANKPQKGSRVKEIYTMVTSTVAAVGSLAALAATIWQLVAG